MPTENPGRTVSRIAGLNVTNMRFVKEVADGKVDRTSVQGERAHGVVAAQYIPINAASQTIAAGDEAPIATSGDVIMEAGAAIVDGAEVMTDTVGRAITFAVAAGQYAMGKLINDTSAGAAGDKVTVRLYDYGAHL